MSDDFAVPEPPTDTAAEAVEALREHRLARERAAPVADEPVSEPAVKLSDGDDKTSLTAREGAKRVSELRRVEAERAKQYADALGAGERMDGTPAQAGEPSAEQPAPADPDLDLQSRHAALETARQQFEAEQDVERRIGELDGEARNAAELIRKAATNFNTLFADIKSEADLRQLFQTDPQRFQLYHQCNDAIEAGVRQVHATLAQQQEVKRGEFTKIADANDSYWASRHESEYKADPSRAERDAKFARQALESVGLSGPDFENLWNGSATISARDWRVQEVILMASRYLQGQTAADQVRARQLPPVHRPGMRAEKSDYAMETIERSQRGLHDAVGNKALALGAALLKASRQAGRL